MKAPRKKLTHPRRTISYQRMGIRVLQRDKEIFAAKLKVWREREGISQSEAAALLGISVNTLQNWEIARTKPNRFTEAVLNTIMDAPPKRKAKR